jgi:hypothetical protein
MSESEMTRSVSSIAGYLSLEELANCLGSDTDDTSTISAIPSPTRFKLLVHTLETLTLKNRLRSVALLLYQDLLASISSSRHAEDLTSDLATVWAGQSYSLPLVSLTPPPLSLSISSLQSSAARGKTPLVLEKSLCSVPC